MRSGWCELHGDRKPCPCPELVLRANPAQLQELTIDHSWRAEGRWQDDEIVFDHYRDGVYVGTSGWF